jgi:exodeoxyribonuclease VIII
MVSCMLDLETLSLRPDAAVIAIGAAIFDEQKVLHSEGWSLDLATVNGHVDMETLAWWLRQSDEAREAAFGGMLTPFNAAFGLKTFLAQHNPQEYWANDPEFDFVILKQWWARQNSLALADSRQLHIGDYPLGGKTYLMSRSYRTIIAEAERLGYDTQFFRGMYVAHNPVDDAVSQARAVIEARRCIGQAHDAGAIKVPTIGQRFQS